MPSSLSLLDNAGVVLTAGMPPTLGPAPDAPPFDPFALPAFPVSVAHWCLAVAERAHRRVGRYPSLSLIANVRTRAWESPEVPPQQCTVDACRWTALPPVPTDCRVAGTFCVGPRSPNGYDTLPSAVDGLHIYVRIGGPDVPPLWHVAWRCGGLIGDCPPPLAILDDWDETLRVHAELLTAAEEGP